MPQVSVQRLYNEHRDKLNLTWLAGKEGGARSVPEGSLYDPTVGIIAHLNLIHPQRFQVLGHAELGFLRSLSERALEEALQGLFNQYLAAVIVGNGEAPPPALVQAADQRRIALFTSPQPSPNLINILRYWLSLELAEHVNMHGVFMAVLETGVLITGDSAVGKSELGLELISRGHGLVADDVTEFYRVSPETLQGRCPPLLKDFLEVRGLGVLNIRAIFGETAVRPKKNLKLIVHLEKPVGGDLSSLERLPMNATTVEILGIEFPKVVLPVAVGRNLAVLVEAATRNYILKQRGIDSTHQFIERHEQEMRVAGEVEEALEITD
jgi:HPr kinase/phosphorylase